MQVLARAEADRVCAANRQRQKCPARSMRLLRVPLVRETGSELLNDSDRFSRNSIVRIAETRRLRSWRCDRAGAHNRAIVSSPLR